MNVGSQKKIRIYEAGDAVSKPRFSYNKLKFYARFKRIKKMKSFLIKLTVITLGLALIGGLVFFLFLPEFYLPILPFVLLFFYVITISIHTYQLSLAKKDIGKFARSNMLITFFKLILYSVVTVVYIAVDKENAIPFVVCLMLFYLIFTFVEVSETSKIVRSKKE